MHANSGIILQIKEYSVQQNRVQPSTLELKNTIIESRGKIDFITGKIQNRKRGLVYSLSHKITPIIPFLLLRTAFL